VQRDLSRLRAQVVAAHFESAVVPATLIDERVNAKGKLIRNEYPLAAASIDLGLHPGHHVIVVRSSQGDSRFVADLVSGGKVAHKFEAPERPLVAKPKPHGSGTQRIAAAATAGAGVVALGVGGFLGLSAKQRYSESDPYCRGSLCDPQGLEIIEDARSRGNVATIVVGVGALALAAGAVLWFTAPTAGSGKEGVGGDGIRIGLGPSGLVVGRNW
jgi:hypothetical protein